METATALTAQQSLNKRIANTSFDPADKNVLLSFFDSLLGLMDFCENTRLNGSVDKKVHTRYLEQYSWSAVISAQKFLEGLPCIHNNMDIATTLLESFKKALTEKEDILKKEADQQ